MEAPAAPRAAEPRAAPSPTIVGHAPPKVLFAVGSWGLGHATRDLPLIHRLLQLGCEVTIVSTDRALALLRRELGARCEFLEWPDVPKPLARSARSFYPEAFQSVPLFIRTNLLEHSMLQRLLRARRFDRVVADNRYGFHSPRVASYQITHGLRTILPGRNRPFEAITERYCHAWLRSVQRIVVPDYAENGLSGDLSHNLRYLQAGKLEYVGILADVRRRPGPADVDYFVTISGPEPQRTTLEEMVLAQVDRLPGRVVVALGKPEEAPRTWEQGRARVHNYLDRRQQEDLLNRARLVICRSGYTTMMELAELGRQALLVPTPQQTEQEYLGRLHNARGTYLSVPQQKLDLARDAELARAYPGYEPPHRTDESVERFMRLLFP